MKGVVFTDRVEVRDDVEMRFPVAADEVRVQIVNAGLCHSDVSVIDRTIPYPTPVVLGHEGAGVVTEVGDAVGHVAPGDHVVLTTLTSCGVCPACSEGRPVLCASSIGITRPYTVGGDKAYKFANTSVFAEQTIVKGIQAVKIPPEVSFAAACLIGCGVLTGVGAVFNRAKVTHGDTVVVIGVGGIGLSVVQGARLADALRIVAVDTNPAKADIARQFGATDFVNPDDGGLADQVRSLLPTGADHVFECVGHPGLITTASGLLAGGGQCVLLGVPKLGTEASFVVNELYHDKSIMGCRYGSARPHKDIPLLVDLYRAGRLQLDELVTATYPLDEITTALDELHAGKLARGVLEVTPVP